MNAGGRIIRKRKGGLQEGRAEFTLLSPEAARLFKRPEAAI